jgi:hypothetical protein
VSWPTLIVMAIWLIIGGIVLVGLIALFTFVYEFAGLTALLVTIIVVLVIAMAIALGPSVGAND